MSRGKKTTTVILVAVLLIPLAFLAHFIYAYTSLSVSIDEVSSVTLTMPNGKQLLCNDRSEIEFFIDVVSTAKSIKASIRENMESEIPTVVSYDRAGKIIDYRFYPSLSVNGCMFISPDGGLFLIEGEKAAKMLVRDEFQYLYDSYKLPALTLASGTFRETVLPADYEWHYKKLDGVFYEDNDSEKSNGDEMHRVYKSFENSLEFSSKPSEFEIRYATESGAPYPETSTLETLVFESDTVLQATVTAVWSQLGDVNYYGSATWNFKIYYDVPAVVALPEKLEYQTGDCIVISAEHINSDELCELDTLLKTSKLSFMSFGESDKSYAVLPISPQNNAGNYKVNISVGGETTSFTVAVTQRQSSFMPVTNPENSGQSIPKTDEIAQINNTLSALADSSSGKAYFDLADGLLSPISSAEKVQSYGTEINFASTEFEGNSGSVILESDIYKASEGAAVKAVQSGICVYSADLLSAGNTVVIDHGYGIMSCYSHLESRSVSVGDEVAVGQNIGLVGKTGFTAGESLLQYSVMSGGLFIDPQTEFVTSDE